MRQHPTQFVYALTAERAILSILIIMAGFIGLYIHFVQSAIQAAASRERIQRALVGLGTEVGELENSSIALRNSLNESRARELGFVEVEYPVYVTGSPHLGSAQGLTTIRE
ncbi:MAG: hypothetical protein Q8R25_03020 [bacterium]|nr:hypothetical protein [bacterium]